MHLQARKINVGGRFVGDKGYIAGGDNISVPGLLDLNILQVGSIATVSSQLSVFAIAMLKLQLN